MSKFEVLVGSEVRKIFVSAGEDALAFVTDHGTFAFHTYADCCSETWFADIAGFGFLMGAMVGSVEEYMLDDDPKDSRSRQEEDQVMGVKIRTYKGVCTIEYRNSSNGYYGGSCDYVYVPDTLDGWSEITGDWRA